LALCLVWARGRVVLVFQRAEVVGGGKGWRGEGDQEMLGWGRLTCGGRDSCSERGERTAVGRG